MRKKRYCLGALFQVSLLSTCQAESKEYIGAGEEGMDYKNLQHAKDNVDLGGHFPHLCDWRLHLHCQRLWGGGQSNKVNDDWHLNDRESARGNGGDWDDAVSSVDRGGNSNGESERIWRVRCNGMWMMCTFCNISATPSLYSEMTIGQFVYKVTHCFHALPILWKHPSHFPDILSQLFPGRMLMTSLFMLILHLLTCSGLSFFFLPEACQLCMLVLDDGTLWFNDTPQWFVYQRDQIQVLKSALQMCCSSALLYSVMNAIHSCWSTYQWELWTEHILMWMLVRPSPPSWVWQMGSIVVFLSTISKVTTGIVVNIPCSEAYCCFFCAFISCCHIFSIWSLILHLCLRCRHGTHAYFVPFLILMHSTLLLQPVF